jgi:lactate 2-monooxygenase
VDGSITAIEALPEIVEEVGDEATITFDSGIRRGSDIYKALSLGADACLIGRPFIYGLALGGQDGVHHVLENLIADFDLSMGLAGRDDVDDLDRDSLRHEDDL